MGYILHSCNLCTSLLWFFHILQLRNWWPLIERMILVCSYTYIDTHVKLNCCYPLLEWEPAWQNRSKYVSEEENFYKLCNFHKLVIFYCQFHTASIKAKHYYNSYVKRGVVLSIKHPKETTIPSIDGLKDTDTSSILSYPQNIC